MCAFIQSKVKVCVFCPYCIKKKKGRKKRGINIKTGGMLKLHENCTSVVFTHIPVVFYNMPVFCTVAVTGFTGAYFYS